MTQPFQFPNGQLAHNVEDLVKICEQSPKDGIYHLNREDFEKWLDYIGKPDLAVRAKEARLAAVSDQERLQKFLSSCKPQNTAPVNGNGKTATSSIEDSSGDNPVANFFRSIGKIFARN